MLSYIGLGSNIENPMAQVTSAFNELNKISQTQLLKSSSLYRSKPIGPHLQPDFINAIAAIETELEPLELLTALQSIEHAHRRIHSVRWGPRSLDLDILLYGQLAQETTKLTIPHPEMFNRHFVLYPLAEINPDLIMPDGTPLSELLTKCDKAELERLVEETA